MDTVQVKGIADDKTEKEVLLDIERYNNIKKKISIWIKGNTIKGVKYEHKGIEVYINVNNLEPKLKGDKYQISKELESEIEYEIGYYLGIERLLQEYKDNLREEYKEELYKSGRVLTDDDYLMYIKKGIYRVDIIPFKLSLLGVLLKDRYTNNLEDDEEIYY